MVDSPEQDQASPAAQQSGSFTDELRRNREHVEIRATGKVCGIIAKVLPRGPRGSQAIKGLLTLAGVAAAGLYAILRGLAQSQLQMVTHVQAAGDGIGLELAGLCLQHHKAPPASAEVLEAATEQDLEDHLRTRQHLIGVTIEEFTRHESVVKRLLEIQLDPQNLLQAAIWVITDDLSYYSLLGVLCGPGRVDRCRLEAVLLVWRFLAMSHERESARESLLNYQLSKDLMLALRDFAATFSEAEKWKMRNVLGIGYSFGPSENSISLIEPVWYRPASEASP